MELTYTSHAHDLANWASMQEVLEIGIEIFELKLLSS